MNMSLLFKWIATFLALVAGFIVFSPLVNINELLYPVRIDSMYVVNMQHQMDRNLGDDSLKNPTDVLYSPTQLNLTHQKLNIELGEHDTLKGWFLPAKDMMKTATIIIVHDINESKLSLLPYAKAFTDRGLNVCLVDMRGHGETTLEPYTFGNKEGDDIAIVADTLAGKLGDNRITVMGIGLGANAALIAAVKSKNIQSVILQSIGDSVKFYLDNYKTKKLPLFAKFLGRIMSKNLMNELKFDPDTMTMFEWVKRLNKPVFFTCGTHDDEFPTRHTRLLYDSCASGDRQYWPIREASHFNIPETAGGEYYNQLTIFVQQSMPRKEIKGTRLRRVT